MSKQRKPTKKQIERVANAIKFLVPLSDGSSGWTPLGIKITKWPTHFTKEERKVIRLIAKTAVETLARG